MSKAFKEIKPGTIRYPDEWKQKADTAFWPLKEGLWFRNEDEEYTARIMCLSMTMMEIPEAREDLRVCEYVYREKYAPAYQPAVEKLKIMTSSCKNPSQFFCLWRPFSEAMLKKMEPELQELLG